MARIVDYYLAPQSPWTYLGHRRFVALLEARGATARVKPVDMGRVFAATGGLPLGQRPKERQSYRLLELARFAKREDVALNLQPRFFPVAGDRASYRIIAATEHGSERALALALAIHRAVWHEERDIADEDTLDAIAASCGFNAAALRAAADTASTRARYEENTADALDAGVFGAPTYVPQFGPATGERFWGQDRIDLLADALDA